MNDKLIGYQKNGINYGNFLGMEQMPKNQKSLLKLVANPSQNLIINWLAKDAGTISIYSNAGALVIEQNIAEGIHQIELPAMASGLYMIKGTTANHIEVIKFIIE